MILPSDHYVEREEVLRQATLRAVGHVSREPWSIVLLGIEPDDPDPEYGWIQSAPGEARTVRPVLRFVEKPGAQEAARLMAEGALVNSFVLVATARQLLRLYEESQPALLRHYLMNLPLERLGARGPGGSVSLPAGARFLPRPAAAERVAAALAAGGALRVDGPRDAGQGGTLDGAGAAPRLRLRHGTSRTRHRR